MKRVIKVRAWDTKNQKMYYYNPLSFLDELDGYDIGTRQVGGKMDYIDSHFSKSTNEKMIIMQYTNLSDKNGREIYECDIIKIVTTNIKGEQENIGVVEYRAPEFYCRINDTDYSFLSEGGNAISFEIIGNIYENKDLLK